jgi:DNA-binding transcriptional MerR regulator
LTTPAAQEGSQAVEKSPGAFRTISEVAEDLDLPQHVLRFWETRFTQIKPLKRGGGRRYYRPDDVDLLKGIRYYLYGEGYTIKGVQRILKDRGIRHVTEMGRAQNENYAPPVATIPRVEDDEKRRERMEWPEALPASHLSGADGTALPARSGGTQRVSEAATSEPRHAGLAGTDGQRRLQAALRDLLECKRILDELG